MADNKMKGLGSEVELMNALLGKVYSVLTTGGKEANRSEDHFFVWCTPGVPVKEEDFRFAEQGLTGVVKKPASVLAPKEDESRPSPESKEEKQTPSAPTKEGEQTTSDPSKEGTQATSESKAEKQTSPELSEEEINRLLASDTTRMYMQAEGFARLVDFIPDIAPSSDGESLSGLSVLYNEGGVSSIYDYALRMSQVMKTELPDDVKEKIKRFNDLLTIEKKKKDIISGEETTVLEEGPIVTLYREKMRAYNVALAKLNARRVAALTAKDPAAVHDWALNAEAYQNEVEAAEADWVSRGYKNEYEQIQAFIDQVSRRDMSLLKEQYRNALVRAKLVGLSSGSDFYFTTIAPAGFATSDGWTKFSFKKTDMSSDYSSVSKHYARSPRGRARYFPWVSVSGKHKKQEDSYEMESSFSSSVAEISFEICQVNIVRPWFKEAFLSSKYWRFDANNTVTKGEMLSDGGTPAKGKMPAYPTSIILVRNLRISFDSMDTLRRFQSESESNCISGGVSIGFGPFTIGGGYSLRDSNSETSTHSELHTEQNSIVVEGMQIIGYGCHMLGKSPDPNPDIKEWI